MIQVSLQGSTQTVGWARPSCGEHLPREGLEQEAEAAARTDSRILSAPSHPTSSQNLQGKGGAPTCVVERASPPRRQGKLWSGFQEAEALSYKTQMFLPVPPEAARVKAVGLAGRAVLAGEVGGGLSPPSRSSALSQKCSSWTVVGALLLLLSSSPSPSWGFYKTDKGTALGVRR